MKKYFFAGCVICLPLILTFFIISFLMNVLTQPFSGLVQFVMEHTNLIGIEGDWTYLFVTQEQALRWITQILILISLFIFISLLGLIGRIFIFKYIISISEKILHRIPLINKIYKSSKELFKNILSNNSSSLTQVALVPFPKEDSFVIGFVSNEEPCSGLKNPENYISIFIPTTPNPTSGFLLMYERKDVTYIDMSREDALKYIISCGVITPN